MDVKQFIESRRLSVTLPGGPKFAIRKVGVVDILMAGGNPDLMNFLIGKPPARRLEIITEKLKELDARHRKDLVAYKAFCESLVLSGVVEPRVTPTGSEDTVALTDLTFEECDLLSSAVLRFSGFTMEAAKAIAPLSKTKGNLPISTPSPEGTGSSPATSSDAKTSKLSPSTSHVPGSDSTAKQKKPSE